MLSRQTLLSVHQERYKRIATSADFAFASDCEDSFFFFFIWVKFLHCQGFWGKPAYVSGHAGSQNTERRCKWEGEELLFTTGNIVSTADCRIGLSAVCSHMCFQNTHIHPNSISSNLSCTNFSIYLVFLSVFVQLCKALCNAIVHKKRFVDKSWPT